MNEYKEKHKRNTSENCGNDVPGFIGGATRLWVVLILAAIVAVLVLAGLRRTVGSGDSNKNLSTFTVRRDDLAITVTESGSIRARNTIQVKNEIEEREMTILNVVPEGTYITQEDVNNSKVLVQLDSSNLEEQLTQREIDFASAESSYAEAKEANDIQVNQNESDITAGKLKVKFALLDFKKYLGETVAEKFIKGLNQANNPGRVPARRGPLDIALLLNDPQLGGLALQMLRGLNDNITLAKAKFTQGNNKLKWTRKLEEKKYVSKTELEGDELTVQSLEVQKKQAETSLGLFKLYDFPKDTEKLLSDYEESKRQLERTYARCRSKLAQAQAKLKSAESRHQSRKDRLAKTQRGIKLCTIKAPAPGLVIYGSGTSGDHWRRMRGSGIIEEGAKVYRGQTIISLPDTSEMIAEISVHESWVDKVRPAQDAKIVIGPFPDKTFDGKVIKVAPLPSTQEFFLNPDLKVYEAQVGIDGSYDFLKSGMSAKVEILIEQLSDVIIVPVQVVANRWGKKVCYCSTPQGPEEREVQIGPFNDTFVQITDGLEVGEVVLLNPPRLTEAKVESEQEPEVQLKSEPEVEPESGSEAVEQQKPPQSQHREPQQRGGELTDEAIERIMGHLAEINPEKSEELKQLRESDPEKFKAELRKVMREQFRGGRRGRGDTNRGAGDARVPEKR